MFDVGIVLELTQLVFPKCQCLFQEVMSISGVWNDYECL